LIRRALREGDPWSGHMALPGGRQEPGDIDERATAIRETFEEVALDLSTQAAHLGRLDDVGALARGRRIPLTIAVFVFELERDFPLSFSREVVEALWVPLDEFARGQVDTTVDYEVDGVNYRLPGWDIGGRVVWGLTYRMICALLATLGPPER
jgi:8-oxo-dGTP pyrophosphatase MutT (NUDIX family)